MNTNISINFKCNICFNENSVQSYSFIIVPVILAEIITMENICNARH